MKRPSRDPGEQIKQILRREVNYGCPVRFADGSGCGSPILTFHHFDPPWPQILAHNPMGMVALCPQHHHQADGGLWSKAQLQQLKKFPYVDDTLKVSWPWQPETLVMKVGPSLVIGSGSPIRLDSMPIMRFYPHMVEGLGIQTVVFDSDIRDAQKKRWLRIEDSWFDLRLENTTDVVFTPQTKTFVAKHNDNTFISLQFKKYELREFFKWTQSFITKPEIVSSIPASIEKVRAIDSDGFVPIVVVEGMFKTDKVSVAIKGDKMHFECFLPGLQESFEWHSWVVDDIHRAKLLANGCEFFSLG